MVRPMNDAPAYLASIEYIGPYFSEIGGGADHQQNHHENARKVKDGAHRCL